MHRKLSLIILIIINLGVLPADFAMAAKPAGERGEEFVREKLAAELDQNYYKIINNVLVATDSYPNTAQIDHIVISDFGIFCLETKDYSGWIFGRADKQYWTQFVNFKRRKFYSPLGQNYAHVAAIKSLLQPLNISVSVYSFVVFTDAGRIRVTGASSVGYARDKVITAEERDKIYQTINQANILDEEARQTHIKKVSEIKEAARLRTNR
jgi:hypothetical protein